MVELLQQLQSLVDSDVVKFSANNVNNDVEGQNGLELAAMQSKLCEIREKLEQAGDHTSEFIEDLRQCAANPGSQYYFIIFIALYGGVYFFQ